MNYTFCVCVVSMCSVASIEGDVGIQCHVYSGHASVE